MADSARAYVIVRLVEVPLDPALVTYLRRIDATVEAHGGRFLVHGGEQTALEGEPQGDVVVIEFPDRASALAWYGSPEYQAILPLRRQFGRSEAVVVAGVEEGFRARHAIGRFLARP